MIDQTRPLSPEIGDRKKDSTELHNDIHQVMMEQQSRIIHEVNTVIDEECRSTGDKE
jgi:hypothetical protein